LGFGLLELLRLVFGQRDEGANGFGIFLRQGFGLPV
jgi:hypothetical protein